eukprot:1160220-Pelagomonas_calceolata.AAC.1
MDMAGNKKGKLGHCALFTQEAAAQANDLRLVGSACKTLPGYCEASMLNELQLACPRKEKGHIAVPAYMCSLAEVKTVPATNQSNLGDKNIMVTMGGPSARSFDKNIEHKSQHFKHADTNLGKGEGLHSCTCLQGQLS